MDYTGDNYDEFMKFVDAQIEQPLVTARFGNDWKEHVKQELEKDSGLYTVDDIIDIAWRQGRKAIILERYIKNSKQTLHGFVE